MRRLNVFIDTRQVGVLQESDDLWHFEYADAWLDDPRSFDLSPALTRAQRWHHDGGSTRPVQWYFDNLLPEELLRESIAREAALPGDDAFALLAHLGAESAGSLTLRPDGAEPVLTATLRPLPDAELSRRIANLPRKTLTHDAPKRMSLAGAQHKLLVVLQDGQLHEPVGATPSTHILKPEHPQMDLYPASVFNEHFTMTLARLAKLNVPQVQMRFVPQPVFVVDRFDRRVHRPDAAPPAAPHIERFHIVDACQLLNKARGFKHTGATLDALGELSERTTHKAATRLRLFQWLAFNTIVGNDNCHLKNLSFRVDADGIALAPHYDLLCTGAWHTKAFADERALWPNVPMAIPLPGASTFGEVTPDTLQQAGERLGIPARVSRRLLAELRRNIERGLTTLQTRHAQQATETAPAWAATAAQATRLLHVIAHITLPDMLKRTG